MFYGVDDDIRNVMSDCMLIICLVAFFGFTNNIKPLECIMIQALTRHVWYYLFFLLVDIGSTKVNRYQLRVSCVRVMSKILLWLIVC